MECKKVALRTDGLGKRRPIWFARGPHTLSGLTSRVLSATCSTDGMGMGTGTGIGTGRGEDMGAGAAVEHDRQCLDRSSVACCSEKFSTLG